MNDLITTTAPLTCGICETPATHREFFLVDGKWNRNAIVNHWDLCRKHAKQTRDDHTSLPDGEVVAHTTLVRESALADAKAERADLNWTIEHFDQPLGAKMGWNLETSLRVLARRIETADAKAELAGERAFGLGDLINALETSEAFRQRRWEMGL